MTKKRNYTKRKSSVRSPKEYVAELDGLVVKAMTLEDKENDTLKLTIKMNKAVHPYIRHRISGRRTYDPLSLYKNVMRDHIEEALNKYGIKEELLLYKHRPITMEINVSHIPSKSNSIKNIYRMLEGKIQHVYKPDTDNFAKSFNDVINMVGSIWNDDSQISYLLLSKKWDIQESTEIIIYYLPENDDSQLSKEERESDLYEIARQIKHGDWSAYLDGND